MDKAVFAKITVHIKVLGIIAEICACTWEPSDHNLMVYIKHETVSVIKHWVKLSMRSFNVSLVKTSCLNTDLKNET
jgi:hypothetical protein